MTMPTCAAPELLVPVAEIGALGAVDPGDEVPASDVRVALGTGVPLGAFLSTFPSSLQPVSAATTAKHATAAGTRRIMVIPRPRGGRRTA
ncbi:hypothetical protein [Dermacoccus barathri]|uniref:hypothetical protein n=1 Tax=Dermacoccus barathri TaxID=322601 RepID=UPI00187A7E7F|nr:hypothetical protein [Dermacoccus barathri]MBE7370518.1 hypothetical protein [Dermacoccus barathri]